MALVVCDSDLHDEGSVRSISGVPCPKSGTPGDEVVDDRGCQDMSMRLHSMTSVHDLIPDEYPKELECEVATTSGALVTARPIRPDDAPALARFHRLLTPKSVYRRYFYVHPDLSVAELDHLTRVDYVDRMAMVAAQNGNLVAVARYDRSPGTTEAEVAFVVTEAYQHLGLGTQLLAKLAERARQSGIVTFQASVLAENGEMLHVFRSPGWPVAIVNEVGVLAVRMTIDADETPSRRL
jgi:GNAT superfamily N-acetyltransferase